MSDTNSDLLLMERLSMALAEAGYPNARVARDSAGDVAVTIYTIEAGVDHVPEEVVHRAFAVVDPQGVNPCFDCWSVCRVCEVH